MMTALAAVVHEFQKIAAPSYFLPGYDSNNAS